ncbi:MAG: peptidase M3, partial [Gammaproteobacteria bacterium]|nr:peptidase M3 [Gammaproteobacteria bacterium]
MTTDNPFYASWQTPFGIPPFEQIKTSHYLPAFEAGVREREQEIQTIINNPQPADFENTIEALEASGALLEKVLDIFFNLTSAHTNDELQALQQQISPA